MSVSPPTAPLVARFMAQAAGVPKHLRLREAIIAAVEAGELPLGQKMAGERELSQQLGLSLGTTQKALGRLMDEGFLVRRQGHGTFVGSMRQPVAGSWHFRFVPPERGAELPVFASLVSRQAVLADGPWSVALGADPKGYVHIRRSLDIGGRFTCASDLYLGASRFSRLLRMAAKRLADVNLKSILASDFAAPTLQSEGLAQVAPIAADDALLIGVAPGTWGLQVHIVGRSYGHVATTFQRMVVPPTNCALKLDFNPPGPHPA